MRKLKTAFVGATFAAVAFAPALGSTMPINNLGATSQSLSTEAQTVVWICGWYRCWWRPVFVYPSPYGYYRPYWGWQRPYWGWRRWWW
jgi:hypothetical protein